MQKSYFQMTLEKTIRQTEKLLKILQAVQTDYADKRMEAAMEKAVSAAKQAEKVALPDWLVPSSIRVEPMPSTTTGIRC